MNRWRVRLPLACLLLGLGFSACCQAESLRLVSGDDYAPYTGAALPGGGLLSQVVQAALARQKIASSLAWRPWNRGYRMTLMGEFDATFPYVRSPERESEFLYSTPLIVAEQQLFSRAGDNLDLDNPQSLRGKRLCSPLGWQPPKVIQELLEQGLLTRHAPLGLKECARLLLLGRDDFFVAAKRLGETALASTGAPLTQFRSSSKGMTSSTLHLIVPRRHPRATQIIDLFDKGLAELQGSGDYQRLIEDYQRQIDQP